ERRGNFLRDLPRCAFQPLRQLETHGRGQFAHDQLRRLRQSHVQRHPVRLFDVPGDRRPHSRFDLVIHRLSCVQSKPLILAGQVATVSVVLTVGFLAAWVKVGSMSSRESEPDRASPGHMSRGISNSLPKDRWTSGDAYEIWMGRWSRLLADDFLRWLALPPRASWLDVCCGTGILSVAIAEACKPSRVVGIDRSPPKVEFARRHHAGRGIEVHLAEATALPFAERSFDACVSGLGLNFVPDPIAALREMRRVTRPGGSIAAYVWEYSGPVRFLREFWDVATAVDPEAASFDQGRRFPICTRDGLRAAYEEAGLAGADLRALE